jgi:hypothetical protein
MRRAFVSLVGAVSLTLAGCGAEPEKGASSDAPEGVGDSDDVGVSMSKLTNCRRTELAYDVVGCGGRDYYCEFALMENNFECSEGVVGQASTETLYGTASTHTTVETMLFGERQVDFNGHWIAPVSIAAQWGHAFASNHLIWCQDPDDVWHSAEWNMDPWSKRAVLSPLGMTCN